MVLGEKVKVYDSFLEFEIEGEVVKVFENGDFKINSGNPYMDGITFNKIEIKVEISRS